MKISNIKQQAKHYFLVLRWMMGSYYREEKGTFWLIQITMGLSVGLGVAWLLGVITGLQFLNDSSYLSSIETPYLEEFFSFPICLWLTTLSIAGLLGTAVMFLSIHLGVKSIIRFQLVIMRQVLQIISQTDDINWLSVVEDEPRKKLHRIVKLSVQMAGLVTRRLVRMLIPVLTFLVAMYALYELNTTLLNILVPLSVFYVVSLYFINRYAARNQVKLSSVTDKVHRQMGGVIDDMLYQNNNMGQSLNW